MIRRTCPNTINSAKAEKASSQTTWLHHQLYLEQLTYLLAACFLSFKMGIVLHSLGDHSRLRIQPCCCCGMGDVPGPGTSACCGHHCPPPQEKKNCRNLKKKPQSPTREDEPRQPAPRRHHPPARAEVCCCSLPLRLLSEPLAAWMSRPAGPTSVVTLCLPLCRCEAPKHPAVDRCFRSVGSYCVPCRRHPGPWGPRASDPADAERGAWGAQLLQADGRSRATVGRPAVNASSWARGSI